MLISYSRIIIAKMGRAPCCDKANVKKGPWSPEEDAKLKSYIDKHGTGGNWIALPQKIGLKRCGKSCRLRWLNYLRPNLKHGGFSEEEDRIICSLYITIGSRWSIIAAQLPGRTDNDIKNYWNTKLKKKLLGKQRKDQQAASRRGKQLVKTNNDNDDNNNSHQNPYWPELPVLTPVYNHDQQYHHSYEQSVYAPSTCSSSSLDGLNYVGSQVFDTPYINMLQGQGDEEIKVDGMEFLCGGQEFMDGKLSMNNNSSGGVGGWGDISALVCPTPDGLQPDQATVMPEYVFSELTATRM